MSSSRHNFSSAIKKTVADRAGGVCSFPGCNQSTLGPSKENSKKAIRNGIAAHINAAAKGGPRYDPLQSEEARKSIENAIWMCPTHGSLIDKEETAYTPSEIRDWKHNAELRAKQRLELTSTNEQPEQKYTGKDIKILKSFAEKMPYENVLVLKNQVFGSRVPSVQIDIVFDILHDKGNPEYEFNSPELQTLKKTLLEQIELFYKQFSQHSSFNNGHYDYINAAEWGRYGSADYKRAIQEIKRTQLLASEVCDTLLEFLRIKSNLN